MGDGTWTLSPDDLVGLQIGVEPTALPVDFTLDATGTLEQGEVTGQIPVSLDDDDIDVGSSADDVLIASEADAEMFGLEGDDIMIGQAGENTMHGGSGRDIMSGNTCLLYTSPSPRDS